MAALSESLQLRKRVEALLEAQGFEDADEWGPDLKGCLRWAKEVEPGDICSALSNLVSFLEELDSAGIQQDLTRRIVGDGKRTVRMMKDLLEVHNTLVGEGHDDQIESIVTSSTTISTARRLLKTLLEEDHNNPPSALEERATKRQRKQTEHPGYVSSVDPTLSCASNPIPACVPHERPAVPVTPADNPRFAWVRSQPQQPQVCQKHSSCSRGCGRHERC